MSLSVALIDAVNAVARLPGGIVSFGSIGRASLVGSPATQLSRCEDVVLVGCAFRTSDFSACEIPKPQEAAEIVRTGGRWAIDNLWGNYILAWADAENNPYILRSPVTGPAIYHAPSAISTAGTGQAIAFTDLTLARSLGFRLDVPDPAAIDAEMRVPLLRGRTTGLSGVSEILPGEIWRLGGHEPAPGGWSPWDYARGAPSRVEPCALRELVMRIVSAWSARFDCIQLELSGGLDSSIVAACLAGRRGDWRAVTLATSDPDGDERVYARAAAERAGAALAELMIPPEAVDPTSALARARTRPGGFGLLAPVDAALGNMASDYGATAIFTGAGGDNVFGYLTSPAPIVDALRFEGAGAAWRSAGDLARITNDNVWRALRLALRKMIVAGPNWPVDTSFLSTRFAGTPPRHPWFEGSSAWPGQRTYALKLLPIQPFLDGYDRALDLPMIAPLLSQPLVEFGLRVPSWQWGEGGRDRALARRAFANDVPSTILNRRIKGRIESLFYPSFEQFREPLRHFLLEGWLAGEDLLDRDAIAALFDRRTRVDSTAILRLFHIADIERWVRSHLDRGRADVSAPPGSSRCAAGRP